MFQTTFAAAVPAENYHHVWRLSATASSRELPSNICQYMRTIRNQLSKLG